MQDSGSIFSLGVGGWENTAGTYYCYVMGFVIYLLYSVCVGVDGCKI